MSQHYYSKTISIVSTLLLAALILGITACEKEQIRAPAPLNDVTSLEKLATAYNEISQQFPVSPSNLAPGARRKFVEQVFTTAGYGYEETLASLSEVKKDDITKLHRDMRELLFLPHYGLPKEALAGIYSERELAFIAKINNNFK